MRRTAWKNSQKWERWLEEWSRETPGWQDVVKELSRLVKSAGTRRVIYQCCEKMQSKLESSLFSWIVIEGSWNSHRVHFPASLLTTIVSAAVALLNTPHINAESTVLCTCRTARARRNIDGMSTSATRSTSLAFKLKPTGNILFQYTVMLRKASSLHQWLTHAIKVVWPRKIRFWIWRETCSMNFV